MYFFPTFTLLIIQYIGLKLNFLNFYWGFIRNPLNFFKNIWNFYFPEYFFNFSITRINKLFLIMLLLVFFFLILIIMLQNSQNYFSLSLNIIILIFSAIIFSTSNLLIFFLTYELISLLLYFNIYFFGKEVTKLRVGINFILYSTISSLFLLFANIIVYINFNSFNITPILNQLNYLLITPEFLLNSEQNLMCNLKLLYICSYLLINFWNLRVEANKASLKAILINKLGDAFIILFFLVFYVLLLTTGFTEITFLYRYLIITSYFSNLDLLYYSVIALFIGACTKSAQLIFSVWLFDAMEGPTPVSALIHSSTMVAAGYILLIKTKIVFLLYLAPNFNLIYFILLLLLISNNSLLTYATIISGDIKKSLAFSTISQISLMFIITLLCNTNYLVQLSIYHYSVHALYKFFLFLIIGMYIHQNNNIQTLTRIGANWYQNPVTHTCLLMYILNILGVFGSLSHLTKSLVIILSLNPLLIKAYYLMYVIILIFIYTSLSSLHFLFNVFNFNINSSIFFKSAYYYNFRLLPSIESSNVLFVNTILYRLCYIFYL